MRGPCLVVGEPRKWRAGRGVETVEEVGETACAVAHVQDLRRTAGGGAGGGSEGRGSARARGRHGGGRGAASSYTTT